MKDKIRQILREETSEFDPKMLEQLYKFMNNITKNYIWYHDTPEQRFRYRPETIWLINPETKEWAVELQKGGWLWWSFDFYLNFRRYFNMEYPDYDKFIKLWVEDVLNRTVTTPSVGDRDKRREVIDAIEKGKQLK